MNFDEQMEEKQLMKRCYYQQNLADALRQLAGAVERFILYRNARISDGFGGKRVQKIRDENIRNWYAATISAATEVRRWAIQVDDKQAAVRAEAAMEVVGELLPSDLRALLEIAELMGRPSTQGEGTGGATR